MIVYQGVGIDSNFENIVTTYFFVVSIFYL